MLTDDELNQMSADAAEMQRLREAATPGPWKAQYPRSDDLVNVRIFAGSEYLGSVTNSDQDTDTIKANADFIAAARSDKSAEHVERLVQEVKRLRRLTRMLKDRCIVQCPQSLPAFDAERFTGYCALGQEAMFCAAIECIESCHIHGVPVPEHLQPYEVQE